MTTKVFPNQIEAWDQYAAAALQALVVKDDYSAAQITVKAAEFADQLLEQRNARTNAANDYITNTKS